MILIRLPDIRCYQAKDDHACLLSIYGITLCVRLSQILVNLRLPLYPRRSLGFSRPHSDYGSVYTTVLQ